MAQAILTSKGTVVTRRTLCKLLKSDIVCDSDKRKRNLFDDIIEKNSGAICIIHRTPSLKTLFPYEDDSEEAPSLFQYDANPVESDCTAAF